MAQKIKLFRRVLNVFTNRKFIFIFLFFVIGFSLFAHPFTASAQGIDAGAAASMVAMGASMGKIEIPSLSIWGNLVSAVKGIAAFLIILVSVFAAFISSFAATLATLLVGWILSPNFIDVSYTNPGGPHANPIIKIGLEATQGFVNLGLILALVYIALTTMLGLAGRETKKLLFYFVLVALLVNFAPVLCGIVVDASNIAMNAFIKVPKDGTWAEFGSGLLSRTKSVYDAVIGPLSESNFSDLATTVNALTLMAAQLAALTAVNIFITIVYLLYALIFMVRYVFIWVLVILSPLAFVCYITPKTKKYFDQWLGAFLQWCFIGIPAAFFLNLGEKTTELMGKLYGNRSVVPSSTLETAPGFISTLFFAGVPILFLAIGFIFSMQMSAAGSGAIMNFSKKVVKGAGAKAGGRIGRTLEDKFRVRERAKKAVSWFDKTAGKGGVAGIAGKMTRWAIPDRLRQYSENRAGIEGIKAKYSKESSIALMDGLTSGRFTGIEAAAVMEILRERGDGNDILEGYKRKLGIDNDKDLFNDKRFTEDPMMRRALEVSDEAGKLGKILRNEPRLAAILAGSDIGGEKRPFKNKTDTQVLQKYMGDIKNADIRTWEKEVGQHHGTMEAFMGSKGEDAFNALGDNKGGVAVPLKTFDENYSRWVDSKGGTAAANTSFNDYIDALESDNGQQRGDNLFRKALDNIRFTSKGWRQARYIGKGGGTTPGNAAGLGTIGTGPEQEIRFKKEPSTLPRPQGRTAGGSTLGPRKKPPAQGRRAGGKTPPSPTTAPESKKIDKRPQDDPVYRLFESSLHKRLGEAYRKMREGKTNPSQEDLDYFNDVLSPKILQEERDKFEVQYPDIADKFWKS